MITGLTRRHRLPRLLSVLLVLSLIGCTHTETFSGGSSLPDKIRSENLIKRGQDIEIRTVEGETHNFKVMDVDDELVQGDHIAIPIDDITYLKTDRISYSKTLLIGAIIVAAIIIAADSTTSNICNNGACNPQ